MGISGRVSVQAGEKEQQVGGHKRRSVISQNLHLLVRSLKTLFIGESLNINSNDKLCLEYDSMPPKLE